MMTSSLKASTPSSSLSNVLNLTNSLAHSLLHLQQPSQPHSTLQSTASYPVQASLTAAVQLNNIPGQQQQRNLVPINQDVNSKYLNFVTNGLLESSRSAIDVDAALGGGAMSLGSMSAGSTPGSSSSLALSSAESYGGGGIGVGGGAGGITSSGVGGGSGSIAIDALSESHLTFVIVKCLIIGFIILAAILGNMLVIVSVMRHRKLR